MHCPPVPVSNGSLTVVADSKPKKILQSPPSLGHHTYSVVSASHAEKVHAAAMRIFGSIESTIHHYFSRELEVTAHKMGRPRYLTQEVARRARKLHFLTDFDVARNSLKKINAERLEARKRLNEKRWPLYDEREDLKKLAASLREKLEDLKSLQKEAEKTFYKANKLYDAISNSNDFAAEFKLLSMDQVLEKSQLFWSLADSFKKKVEEKERQAKEIQAEIEKLTKQLHTDAEKADCIRMKLESNFPKLLSQFQVYPHLIMQCGDETVLFSPNIYRIKVNFTTSPTLAYDSEGQQPTPEDIDLLVRKIAKGLKVMPLVLQNEVETSGWQQFLETRVLPQTRIDYQSADVLASLAKKISGLPLANSLEEKDIVDAVSLGPFKNPITLTCGHTFSRASLHTEDKCPQCRKKIDYDEVLPNVFLEQLSLIFKQNRHRSKLEKLLKNIPEASEQIKQLRFRLEQIRRERLHPHASDSQLHEFKESLYAMDRTNRLFFRKVKSLSDKFNESPYDLLRQYQKELDAIEEKIDSITNAIHHLKISADAAEPIDGAGLSAMAHALADSSQRGDLVAVIPMDIARKEYVEKLKNKLEMAKKDLAAVEYMQFHQPEFMHSAEVIFDAADSALHLQKQV